MSSLASVSPSSIDLTRLTHDSNITLGEMSEIRARDVSGRVRAADLDGVVRLANVDRRKALLLVRRLNELDAGTDVRHALRTPDARALARELLSLFSEGATSQLGKNAVLSLAPSLDRKVIEGRLEACVRGQKIREELIGVAKLDAFRDILSSRLSFAQPKKSKRTEANESELAQYFLARRGPIEIANSVLTGEFRDCPSLVSVYSGIDAKSVLEILRILQELERAEVADPDAAISDAEILINQQLKRGGLDEGKVRTIVDSEIDRVVATLKLDAEEEGTLRRAAFEQISVPFEFDRAGLKRTVESWKQRQEELRRTRIAKLDAAMGKLLDVADAAVQGALFLDRALAIAWAMDRYRLSVPTLGQLGLAFVGGRSIFLEKDRMDGTTSRDVQAIDYGLGKTQMTRIGPARPRNVVMLTGANSGGKTTLLATVATVHISCLLGVPVACSQAEVAPLPLYLFRKRVTRKVGSLEQAMKSLIPVFADRRRKLVLMDEFEALTEPGAAGRILATLMNEAATTSSLVLLVTHLARETLPYVKLPVRVDGIEAQGLDQNGELVVDRQPQFDHIGSSTPKLIVMRLSQLAGKRKNINNKNAAVQRLYGDILNSLEGESTIVQTPIGLPWISSAEGEN